MSYHPPRSIPLKTPWVKRYMTPSVLLFLFFFFFVVSGVTDVVADFLLRIGYSYYQSFVQVPIEATCAMLILSSVTRLP